MTGPAHLDGKPVVAVVEDDAPLLGAIRFALEAEGFGVRAYESGEDLLAAEGLCEIVCFVVDHKLPKLDGLRVIEALKDRGCPGKALMITTRPAADLREACWVLGTPIVEKPLLGEALSAAIVALLSPP